jgi:hypothetical protein
MGGEGVMGHDDRRPALPSDGALGARLLASLGLDVMISVAEGRPGRWRVQAEVRHARFAFHDLRVWR